MATDKCIFCGGRPTTREHVFSRWTHKYMAPRKGGRERILIEDHLVNSSNKRVAKLRGELRDWKIQCVCSPVCNNGWMKKIEDDIISLLKALILGSERRVLPSEQKRIATWAILKAIVSEYDDKYKGHIHYKQRLYIKTHGLAPLHGWAVWIGCYERNKWLVEWASRPMLIVPKSVAVRKLDYTAGHFNSNATTQIIGKFFVHVIHFPMPTIINRWRFSFPHKGALCRIWPPTDTSIKWPPPALDDEAAERISDAFFFHIQNAQRKLAANASPEMRERFLRVSAKVADRLKS
jgi:hypothetical protein